ncbi:DUF6230 family protein [Yinghuangia aomiensis]
MKIPLPFSILGHDSVVMVIKSGGTAKADNMVANLAQLQGEATFKGVDIGIDGQATTKGPIGGKAPAPGMLRPAGRHRHREQPAADRLRRQRGDVLPAEPRPVGQLRQQGMFLIGRTRGRRHGTPCARPAPAPARTRGDMSIQAPPTGAFRE